LLRRITFFVTDTVEGPGAAEVFDVYRSMVGWVSEIVGPPVATKDDSYPITWWDLPSGGGVKFFFIDGSVTMELLSKKSAEDERFDREHPEYTYE
jgi:hypothetical protein